MRPDGPGPSTGAGAKAGELASIQFLRFLASTLVVLFHSEVQLYRLSGGARDNHVPFASFGTDLFFVISGFIMVYITYNKRTGFSDFMRRRIVRIVPLYWLYMCALIALLVFGGWLSPIPGIPDSPLWMVAKMSFFFFMFAMVKAIVPRYRYDQLMRIGWKVFLPLSLGWVVIVAFLAKFEVLGGFWSRWAIGG